MAPIFQRFGPLPDFGPRAVRPGNNRVADTILALPDASGILLKEQSFHRS